jgi:2-polyprenyl-3-methyl-5-hydroxy-6-metoxy-1,4-benzoquinol methylase
MELYKNKVTDYFSNTRYDIISFLPKQGVDKLLEIGAGGGDTLVEVKRLGLAKEVVGIELMKLEGSNQSNGAIDKFIYGDVEALETHVPIASFDAILCGDVLEHLIDPWKAIENIKKFLKPGGVMIVSCPNVRYYEMFLKVFIRGSFEYTSHGLFDKTHLRFFCKKDLIKIISGSGDMQIESAVPSFKAQKTSKISLVNSFTLGLFEEFLALQYIVCAKSKK